MDDIMWLRFLMMVSIFAVLCNGYEDRYSCDFNGRWCMWYPKNLTDTCNWKLNDGQYQGKQGYVVLDGANNCYAQLRWAFLWFPVNPKMITFEYYVTGPGPYSLNVTSEKSYKPEWTCQIQPGDQKRVGRAAPMRVSKNVTSTMAHLSSCSITSAASMANDVSLSIGPYDAQYERGPVYEVPVILRCVSPFVTSTFSH
ncbi:unnamed protein product [Acanthosepion pharaonis]|uniref:Uncharacterized protein n=1 Tax=Acanthosepion pharaonis TaxID=158019 RepID=A0A812EUI3_ACAPH|nr:unnamed protein product [Sepia pharaonis]